MELIEALTRQGVRLSAHGDRLRVRGNLTPELRAAVKAHRPELMAALTGRANNDPDKPPPRYVWHYECENGKAAGTYLSRESDEATVRQILAQRHGATVIKLNRASGNRNAHGVRK